MSLSQSSPFSQSRTQTSLKGTLALHHFVYNPYYATTVSSMEEKCSTMSNSKMGKGVKDQRMEEVEKPKAPKGYIPIIVGAGEETEKFLLHVELFKHPSIVLLLDTAAEEFGYDHQRSVIRVPCNVQDFRQMLQIISSSTAS